MKEENWMSLNGQHFSFTQLSQEEQKTSRTEFERSTFSFCRAWLRGEKEFTMSTSGSTGKPKRITVRREQLEASARLTAAVLKLESGDHALLCLDTHYIAGLMMLVRSFVTGMNIVAVEPSANPLASIPSDLRLDFAAFVPYQLQAILDSPAERKKLSSMKAVLVGGASVSTKTKGALDDLPCQVYSTYGMTETLSHIALQRINGPAAQDYFQVLPGIAIATDARGCLTIAAEYLGQKMIVTNDLVNIVGPARFEWLGRTDHVINSGGVKVIAEKVEKESEKALAALGLTNRCFVAGLPDERLGSKVVLVIEGSPFSESQQLNFYRHLEPTLGKYEIPKEILFTPSFVETGTQKIDRIGSLEGAKGKR